MATKKNIKKSNKITKGMAIAFLFLNLLPGFGTFLSGKYKLGLIQLGMFIISVIFIATKVGFVVGVPLAIVDLIWALIISLQTLNNAR